MSVFFNNTHDNEIKIEDPCARFETTRMSKSKANHHNAAFIDEVMHETKDRERENSFVRKHKKSEILEPVASSNTNNIKREESCGAVAANPNK